jgi:hypothetical protein
LSSPPLAIQGEDAKEPPCPSPVAPWSLPVVLLGLLATRSRCCCATASQPLPVLAEMPSCCPPSLASALATPRLATHQAHDRHTRWPPAHVPWLMAHAVTHVEPRLLYPSAHCPVVCSLLIVVKVSISASKSSTYIIIH